MNKAALRPAVLHSVFSSFTLPFRLLRLNWIAAIVSIDIRLAAYETDSLDPGTLDCYR